MSIALVTFAQLSLPKRVLTFSVETKGQVRPMSGNGSGEFALAFGARLALALETIKMNAIERGDRNITASDLAAAAEQWTISESLGMWDVDEDSHDYHGLLAALGNILGDVIVDAGDDR